jgi:hypothetical protein
MEPVTVSAPSIGEIIGGASRATGRLGNQAAATNVSGMTTQLGGILQLLINSGALARNPQLAAEFGAVQDSANRANQKQLRRLGQVNSRIVKDTVELERLKAAKASATAEEAERLDKKISQLEAKIARNRDAAQIAQKTVDYQNQRIFDFEQDRIAGAATGTDELRKAFPELQQTLADAEPWLAKQGQLGAAGEQLMGTLGQGFQAREVGRGAAGEALYDRATQMASSDGRLSAEANRDAVQAARQAFAARGLGTSAASAAAELLNRDQYSRQRMFQDLGFANQISQQDQARQFTNEEARRLGTQMNVGMLGQAFTTQKMLEQEGLGAALQRGQLAGAANPNNMLLSMYGGGQPTGSQALGPAASIANNWATNALNANMFNANSQMWTNAANQYGNYGGMQSGMGFNAAGAGMGALSGAASGAMIGSVVPGIGTAAGAIAGGLIGGASGGFS